MPQRKVSNPLALAVLACLWERPMYPYEITSTLRRRGKEDSIRMNFGSLYAVIKALEKHGFIAPARTEREGNRPERIVYAITEARRRESDAWLRDLLSTPVKEYPDFEAGLSLLPLLPPDVVRALLIERLGWLDRELEKEATMQAHRSVARLPELLTIEAACHEAMVRAERDFVGGLVEKLSERTIGGYDVWARIHELIAEGNSMEELWNNLPAYFGKEVADSLKPD